MSSYIPGAGRKRPMNMLQTPVFADIKKEPPRFVWSRKHWDVDTGRTMMQVEAIPQMQEAAILYQSYDYNSQHAYGKRPTYDVFVNKEFRPPLIDRDDLLPLSRIPRPTIIPRINPSGAHSSGGSVFTAMNNEISDAGAYLTDRIKAGDMRPTFFAPMSKPEDNSVLPDLEFKRPQISASAGVRAFFYKPTDQGCSGTTTDLPYKQFHPSVIAGFKPTTTFNNTDQSSDMVLDYSRPQVSAASGCNGYTTGLDVGPERDLHYSRPQISAAAGRNSVFKDGVVPIEYELEYSNPQISASAGRVARGLNSTTLIENLPEFGYKGPQISASAGFKHVTVNNDTPIELALATKLEGNQAVSAGRNAPAIYGNASIQQSALGVTDEKHQISYAVPNNTAYQAPNSRDHKVDFRQKALALGVRNQRAAQSAIPRAGISTPQVVLGRRKDV